MIFNFSTKIIFLSSIFFTDFGDKHKLLKSIWNYHEYREVVTKLCAKIRAELSSGIRGTDPIVKIEKRISSLQREIKKLETERAILLLDKKVNDSNKEGGKKDAMEVGNESEHEVFHDENMKENAENEEDEEQKRKRQESEDEEAEYQKFKKEQSENWRRSKIMQIMKNF